MEEIWKDIKGFEGLYQVSNLGRVKSLKKTVPHANYTRTFQSRIMKQYTEKNGYARVGLFKYGKGYRKLVHRLVAQAFIPNPKLKPDVNHKDGIKTNNCIDNLEWCTPKENQKHSLDLGLRKASELHGGGCIHITKSVNEKIDMIVENTGQEKWQVTNYLLQKAIELYENNLLAM